MPDDYIQITSGLGEAPPRNIIVLPILFEGEVKAVIELASFLPFSQIHQSFLDQLAESIGVVLNMIQANMRTEELLEQSQKLTQELQSQSKELQQQQEELKRSNSELEQQARTLRQSEELLKEQQEELQQVNEELEEKASLLAEQNAKVEQKNREVESARVALEEKAEQLALSSKYKSEFLANMSHELRTPLNSLLILAKLLVENKERNLSGKQVEFAQTIYSSGTDLLNLINDILDLSKVEAGKMEVNFDRRAGHRSARLRRAHVPAGRRAEVASVRGRRSRPMSPPALFTDGQRLQQVLKNLLSNAFKFTERGNSHALDQSRGRRRCVSRAAALDRAADGVIAFAVTRHGHRHSARQAAAHLRGVPAGRRHDQPQVRRHGARPLDQPRDRATARRRDSRREHAGHGQHVHAVPAGGAAPSVAPACRASCRRPSGTPEHAELRRSREHRRARRRSRRAARSRGTTTRRRQSTTTEAPPRPPLARQPRRWPTIARTSCRAIAWCSSSRTTRTSRASCSTWRATRASRDIVALDGEDGLDLAHAFQPDAITLDIDMPGMDGWAVLDRLKHHPDTRHIPVHIITGIGERQQGLKAGAIAYLEKPVTKEALEGSFTKIASFIDQQVKRLLVVEDDESQRSSMIELISHEDVEITAVGVGAGSARRARTRRTSTAWCSTSASPRARTASSCSRR